MMKQSMPPAEPTTGAETDDGAPAEASALTRSFGSRASALIDHWGRRWVLLGVAVVVALASIVTYVATIPTTYAATSVVAVQVEGPANTSTTELILLAGEYSVYISTEANTTPIVSRYTSEGDQVKVAAVVDSGTATVRITVSSASRKVSADVANALANKAIDHRLAPDRAHVVSIGQATAASSIVRPRRAVYLMAGVVLVAALTGAAVYLMRERRL